VKLASRNQVAAKKNLTFVESKSSTTSRSCNSLPRPSLSVCKTDLRALSHAAESRFATTINHHFINAGGRLRHDVAFLVVIDHQNCTTAERGKRGDLSGFLEASNLSSINTNNNSCGSALCKRAHNFLLYSQAERAKSDVKMI